MSLSSSFQLTANTFHLLVKLLRNVVCRDQTSKTQSKAGEECGMDLRAERQRNSPETKEMTENTEGSADHRISPSDLCGEINPREKE